MTMKDEADRVARTLKAAAESRKTTIDHRTGLPMASRVGDSKFSIVVDGKVHSIAVPWVLAKDKSEAEISKYIVEQAAKVSQ